MKKQHKDAEWFSVAGLTAHMSPIGFHTYATNYLDAASVAPPVNERFAPARLYLVCHAIELLLKASLSVAGKSLKQLASRDVGHDLRTLLATAESAGIAEIVDLERRLKDEIVGASHYYAEKVFEYPALDEASSGYSHSPHFETLMDAGRRLAELLREPCLNSKLQPPSHPTARRK